MSGISTRQTLVAASTVFTARNIKMKNGWVGFESDTGKSKTGNGTTAWRDLDYDPTASGGGSVPGGGVPGQLLAKKSITNYDTEWKDPPAPPSEGITSTPPAGYKKITNLYVDAKGEIVIVYDP